MADTVTDDAPVTTAKDANTKQAWAMAEIDAQDGDSVVGRSVTINRPAAELYTYFRDFANLPSFMDNVERIDVTSSTRSHWVVKAPGGKTVEWDATVTDEAEGQAIAWKAEEGADVANSGRIEFKDAGPRGTVVTLVIAYAPPAGVVGKLIAKMFQREPAIQARRDLRRFKQLMETGEVATNVRTHAQLEEEQK
jgi:uncharacterized membrane protein